MEKGTIYNLVWKSFLNQTQTPETIKENTDKLHYRIFLAEKICQKLIENKNQKKEMCIHNKYDSVSSNDVTTRRKYKIKNYEWLLHMYINMLKFIEYN